MQTLGRFLLHDVVVATFRLDGGAMFGVIPRPLWSRHFPPDELGRIGMVARSLVIQAPHLERTVVVDVGMATHFSDKMTTRHDVRFPHGDEAGAFVDGGVDPAAVTDVIMTHAHFDHVAGLVGPTPTGGWRPLFPAARHHISRAAWQWAAAPSERDQGSFVLTGLSVLEELGLLTLVDEPREIMPGVRLEFVEGHSPGMSLVWVEDQGQVAGYMADLIPTAAHVPLPWIMAYDLQPLVTLTEKRRVLDELIAADALVCLEHDPSAAAVRLARGSRGVEVVERYSVL